jgi:tRNA (guanine-N7-)-methyltransferase
MSRGRRISRIKLVHPTPEAAEKYLREWKQKSLYETPDKFPKLTGMELFNQKKPISMDIGCGTGEYVIAAAAGHPERLFVGIEVSRRVVYYAVNQAAKEKLDNLLFIKADFKRLSPLFAPKSLLDVTLNFPDPNYGGEKKRKNRIFTPEFLDLMANSLIPVGKIQLVTDEEPFFFEMLEIAEADARFERGHSERYLTDFSPPEKTRFQVAWEKFDRPIFRLVIKLS